MQIKLPTQNKMQYNAIRYNRIKLQMHYSTILNSKHINKKQTPIRYDTILYENANANIIANQNANANANAIHVNTIPHIIQYKKTMTIKYKYKQHNTIHYNTLPTQLQIRMPVRIPIQYNTTQQNDKYNAHII